MQNRLFSKPEYVWIFRCAARLARHAATLDIKGRNLSPSHGHQKRWALAGLLIVGPDNTPQFGIDVLALKADIEILGQLSMGRRLMSCQKSFIVYFADCVATWCPGHSPKRRIWCSKPVRHEGSRPCPLNT